nr:MBL fold metallo-hydrolase [Paenibacillus phytorum]
MNQVQHVLLGAVLLSDYSPSQRIPDPGVRLTRHWSEQTGNIGRMLHPVMEKVGVSFDKLKVVILTHQDVDHIGSLPEILKECGNDVKVYAHELDKPYIKEEIPLIKDGHLENPPKGKVDETLIDGQELPFCGRLRVIHTPGHTPGHISLYLRQSKTLIAGDSMYSVDGILGGIHVPTTLDMNAARLSLKKYVDLDIASVVCYHGGLSNVNVNDQIVGLSQGL